MPERIIESDNESVIANLVESGVGLSLVRDEIASAAQEAGRLAVWPGTQVSTQLWFVYPGAREEDPLLMALFDALNDLWTAETLAA